MNLNKFIARRDNKIFYCSNEIGVKPILSKLNENINFLFINSREIFPDRLYKVKMGLTKCRIYFCDKENIEIVQ